MASRAVHVLVFDGFADWEPAYALAELRRWGKRTIVVIGFTDQPVELGVFSASDEQLWNDMHKHGQLPTDAV